MCQIWLNLVLPNKSYSLFKTSFINTSVWMWPLTIILIFFSLASFAAIAAVLFSIGSWIISKFEMSHFKFSAHFNISFSSPIKIGSIKSSFTASWTDNMGKGLPALTIPALILFFLWATSKRLLGQTISLFESIVLNF